MSDKKYVVPEGMLKAACAEYPDRNFDPDGIFTAAEFSKPPYVRNFGSENPIVPRSMD